MLQIDLPREFGSIAAAARKMRAARRSKTQQLSPLQEEYHAALAEYDDAVNAFQAVVDAHWRLHQERRALNRSADAIVDSINALDEALAAATSERAAAVIAQRISDELDALGAVHDQLSSVLDSIDANAAERGLVDRIVAAERRLDELVASEAARGAGDVGAGTADEEWWL